MKRLRNPATVLALMYLALVVALMTTAGELPARVASHFDFSGQADGWMRRPAYLLVTIGFGIVFPLMLPVLLSALRWIPTSAVNLPNRDYWLAPERAGETLAYLVRHALWLSCWQVGLVIALHLLTVDANRQEPPRLAGSIWILLPLFLGGVAIWAWTLVRHFTREPALGDNRAKWGGA